MEPNFKTTLVSADVKYGVSYERWRIHGTFNGDLVAYHNSIIPIFNEKIHEALLKWGDSIVFSYKMVVRIHYTRYYMFDCDDKKDEHHNTEEPHEIVREFAIISPNICITDNEWAEMMLKEN